MDWLPKTVTAAGDVVEQIGLTAAVLIAAAFAVAFSVYQGRKNAAAAPPPTPEADPATCVLADAVLLRRWDDMDHDIKEIKRDLEKTRDMALEVRTLVSKMP